jgi:hypothetical protein
VFIPAKAPVMTYARAILAALKKGVHAIVFATKIPAETLTATRMGVGWNGLLPPM